MSEASQTCNQMTLPGMGNAIFSPESADGPSLPASPDGPTTNRSGQARRHASRSRSPGAAQEPPIQGIYGRTSFDSSVPGGPLSSWESRLRQRLAKIGSLECDLTWKASAMSDGVSLSRLVPSPPHIVEIDSGSLLQAALWVTASARDWKDTPGMTMTRPDGRSRVDQLPRQVAVALWSTPCTPNGGRSPKGGMSITGKTPDGTKRQVDLQAACRMVLEAAMWPTTTSTDAARGSGTIRPQDTGIPLPQRVAPAIGTEQSGLSASTTAKRGVLNPAFPCWLMGYPAAHLSCGVTAMQSLSRSPRKSLAHGSTSTRRVDA